VPENGSHVTRMPSGYEHISGPIPYALLATACLATLLMLRFHGGAIQAGQAQRA